VLSPGLPSSPPREYTFNLLHLRQAMAQPQTGHRPSCQSASFLLLASPTRTPVFFPPFPLPYSLAPANCVASSAVNCSKSSLNRPLQLKFCTQEKPSERGVEHTFSRSAAFAADDSNTRLCTSSTSLQAPRPSTCTYAQAAGPSVQAFLPTGVNITVVAYVSQRRRSHTRLCAGAATARKGCSVGVPCEECDRHTVKDASRLVWFFISFI
jgi:hypothetical protein